jgi:hypothetical protein
MASLISPAQLVPLEEGAWSANVLHAYQILRDSYEHARRVLTQEDGDPIQLRHLADGLIHNNAPLLEGMEAEGVQRVWVLDCIDCFGPLVTELRSTAEVADGRCVCRFLRLSMHKLTHYVSDTTGMSHI